MNGSNNQLLEKSNDFLVFCFSLFLFVQKRLLFYAIRPDAKKLRSYERLHTYFRTGMDFYLFFFSPSVKTLLIVFC